MRYLILFLISFNLQAMSCREYEGLADYLSTKHFVKFSRAHRSKFGKEPLLTVGDVNQARTYAFRFPAFKDFGFPDPGGKGWVPYNSRLPKSGMFGKKVGYEIHNSNGHARLRFDWDDQNGAHFNIEITERTGVAPTTHKVAIGFPCNGQPCTESQYKQLAESMFRATER